MPTVSEKPTTKERMLEVLDEIARKVATGDVCGIVLVATCSDHDVLTRVMGQMPPPHGILILQDIAREARSMFLEKCDHYDDGRPRLRAADDDDEDEEVDETVVDEEDSAS